MEGRLPEPVPVGVRRGRVGYLPVVREYSVPPAITIAETATLADAVWDNAAAEPHRPQFARRTSQGWREVTSGQFRHEVMALAQGMAAAGVKPRSRVGLLSRTRYEWSLADYAILACGAVTVPIYDTAGREQAAWTLSDSGAVACVVETEDHRLLVASVRDQLPEPFHVWGIEAGDLDTLAASGGDPGEIDFRRRAINSGDIASIIYTSGTTGRPRGCALTHRNILTDVGNAVPALHSLFRSADASTLLFLPLAHAFARLIQVGCVQTGVLCAHVPDPRTLPEDLVSFRPSFLLAIPRVFEKFHDEAEMRAGGGLTGGLFTRAEAVATAYSQELDSPGGPSPLLRAQRLLFDRLVYRRLRERLGGRCTAAISGGAPLRPELTHFFRGAGITILEGYGLTETSPAVAVNTPDAVQIGTVGRPLPGVTVRIADDGEVLICGDVVFEGYWNNDEATGEVIDDEGWFHTGDLGNLDDDGFLRITGRKKDLIVTASGKNVSPAVLEDRLRSHPLVGQGIVIGDQKPFIAALVAIDAEAWPRWLETKGKPANTPVAALREDPELVSEVQQAVDQANEAVSRAESIREVRILPRELSQERGELTPTLKVKRSVVQREYADEIESIYRR